MIQPNSPEDASDEGVQIPFSIVLGAKASPPKFTPVANNILLEYQKPSMAGNLHLPISQKPLETIICLVLEVGPECKMVKKGQRVLILTKALVGGPNGLVVDGHPCYFTQEQVVIAVVE